jgi:hypothetical protein
LRGLGQSVMERVGGEGGDGADVAWAVAKAGIRAIRQRVMRERGMGLLGLA